MRVNHLKQKLAAGSPATVIAPYASSAGLVELLGHLGFDGVFLDCEHGPGGWEDVEHMVRAAELAGADPIVRVPENTASTITRALDRGAGGIQVPHINTASDAQMAVDHAKFAPIGHRGWSGWRNAFGVESSSYAEYANAQSMVVLMLEEVQALDNLDDILRVEHVDVFFVAPGDLAQSMGLPGQTDHPQVIAAVEEALQRIRGAGRIAGALVTPKTVERHLELGVLFLYVGLASLLGPAAADFHRRIRPA
jgi:4-hydroxy-2-oxoheptanedioate aldolase